MTTGLCNTFILNRAHNTSDVLTPSHSLKVLYLHIKLSQNKLRMPQLYMHLPHNQFLKCTSDNSTSIMTVGPIAL